MRGAIKTVRPGVYQLTAFELIGSGNYVFQNAKILINGQPLARLTGLERLDRAVALVGVLKDRGIPLALERPLILMNANDELSFDIAHFDRVAEYPGFFCRSRNEAMNITSWASSIGLVKRLDWGDFSNGWHKTENQVGFCERLESLIDFAQLRRSPILALIPQIENQQQTLDLFQRWIDR